MKDMCKTKVVFRAWKGRHGFGVIALFPEENAGHGYCSSYEHTGQHSGADYSGVISSTRAASPVEYEALRQELESIGYDLEIRSRRFYGRR